MGPTSSETLGISSCNARTHSARYSFDTNFGCSPATSRMLRKPCALSARASRRTSSTVSVTRRMGLSREKPQYLQLLTHSLETYSGEESNDFAETLLRERLRTAAKRLQQFAGGR